LASDSILALASASNLICFLYAAREIPTPTIGTDGATGVVAGATGVVAGATGGVTGARGGVTGATGVVTGATGGTE
jgi:hypothetical protein